MRIPLNWLNELLSEPQDPIVIRDVLTRVGLEIESLEFHAPGLSGVVVGQIVAIEAHPNADKLRICQTDVGGDKPLQIVTGAQNVKLHDKIPVATVGTILPGNKPINEAKLRGVESFGMYCSTVELGLPPDIDGVHILSPETTLGLPIADAMSLGDLVLDVAVTANRPDALSVIGVARELTTALSHLALVKPTPKAASGTGAGAIKLGAIDAERCPYYAGLNISGVKVGPSPEWLVKKLEGAGMRAINNVVDATNYIMLLTGQPLHAFDASKIKGGEIRVRLASSGEKLKTLDGVERELSHDDLVIADAERALVVAGLMGGLDAEVDDATTDLFLEAAYFHPEGVRKTGRKLNLSTESSYRFERGVDPEGTLYAMELVRDCILELAGGTVSSGLHEARRQGWPMVGRLSFRLDQIDRLLGVSVPNQEVERLLHALGFEMVRDTDGVFELNSYAVTVPGWRYHDVRLEADLVEEVGRHYGYDRIPAILPPVWPKVVQPLIDRLELRARTSASKMGLVEVMTPSFTSEEAEKAAGVAGANPVLLANPIKELPVMRTAILPGLLDVLRRNRQRGQSRLGVFELGRTYALVGDAVKETLWLGGAVMGAVWEGMWLSEHTPAPLKADFFFAKGLVENVFAALDVGGELSFHPSEAVGTLHPGRTAEIRWNGEPVGFVGELHPRVVEAFDLPLNEAHCGWMLDVSLLAAKGGEAVHRFVPFSDKPALLRDLAVLVPAGTAAESALSAIREVGGPLLEKVSVFDRYEGNQVPEGQVSLGFSLVYRAPDRTLSVADVEPTQQAILDQLKDRFGAVMRG